VALVRRSARASPRPAWAATRADRYVFQPRIRNLIGLRGTHGLSSRTGVMPLSSTQDIAGPLARNVTDLAIMLDAPSARDPADAITAQSAGHIPKSYRDGLKADGLKGARIGVLRALWGDAPEDAEVAGIVRKALDGFKAQGREVVDIAVPGSTNCCVKAA
jgi:Asp-tRNA(Asn)/Glu-tRNA(Gln) amidotransferase A subunit family amidase